jgi:hypothetical protein
MRDGLPRIWVEVTHVLRVWFMNVGLAETKREAAADGWRGMAETRLASV